MQKLWILKLVKEPEMPQLLLKDQLARSTFALGIAVGA
jgi:hypothetical protein